MRLLVYPIDDLTVLMTVRSGSSPISGRIPNVLYRWLEAKVKSGEYPNLNQALTAQLTIAKTVEEERETHRDLLKMRSEIVRDTVEELKKERVD